LPLAILVTTIQWAVLFSPVLYTQSVRAVADPVAEGVFDGALPVIVVSGRRQS
jgi:hypothetical protein